MTVTTGGNRARSWGVFCDACGMRYLLTNFMRRYAIDGDGRLREADVHEAKCEGWEVLDRRTDRRHPDHPSHGWYVIEQAHRYEAEARRILNR